MEAVDPIERAGVEEIGDLVSTVVVNGGVPVGVEAAARVGVLVERTAVEPREPVRVGREMGGNPIEDDSEPGGMGAIDEAGETVRRAVAARRREQADRLIAPRLVERMLGDRQQLEMGEAEVGGVGDELVGEFVVSEEAIVGAAPPRTEMDLEDRHRLASRFALPPAFEIVGVAPLEMRGVGDDRGGRGPHFGRVAERIGLERQQDAVRAENLVFVDRAGAEAGNEHFPQAAVDALAHLRPPSIPAVEVADHRDAGRVGGPDGESDAVDAFVATELRAQAHIKLAVRALDQQVLVQGPEHRAEGVGVVDDLDAVGARQLQSVGGALAVCWARAPRRNRPSGARIRQAARRRASPP